MKRSTTLLFMMLAAAFPCVSIAQQSPAASVVPWNGLDASRVPATYQTIIGATGTTLVAGSRTSKASDTTFPLQLPFAMRFLNTNYAAGSIVRVSVGGFLSFNTATQYGFFPYNLLPDPGYAQLIMPYWTDLKTTSTGDEGIYQRVTVEPVTGDSIWTIEWSVETMTAPFTSGRFQLHLTQRTPPLPGDFRTEIQFDYDTSSPLDRSGTDGAQTGLKNLGQGIGLPATVTSGIDDDKYLLMTFPGAVTPYMVGATRLPTRKQYFNYTPDWFGRWVWPTSEFFHYTFPDSSYRLKPVDADAICLLPPDPSHSGNGHTFIQGANATCTIAVLNEGTSTLAHVPIHVRITLPNNTVDTLSTVVNGVAPDAMVSTTIPIKSMIVGRCRLLAWVSVPLDQDPTNDTASWTYFVTPAHDGMATAIVSPQLVDRPSSARYTVGMPIPIQARIANVGSQQCPAFIAGYTIVDTNDSIIVTKRDTINGNTLTPGTQQVHTFGMYVPHQPGLYRIDVFCAAMNDSLRGDDTLHSIPMWDWISHGPTPDARGVAPVPFEVFYPTDLAVEDPVLYPHLPRRGDTIQQTAVMALFANYGGLDVSNVMAHAVITDESGSAVYDRTDLIRSIAGGGRVCQHFFADFVPHRTGSYCVTVWVRHDSLDPVTGNDTASWCFYAIGDSTQGDHSNGGTLGQFLDAPGSTAPAMAPDTAGAAEIAGQTMRRVGGSALPVDCVGGLAVNGHGDLEHHPAMAGRMVITQR